MSDKPLILVLCTGNSARSQMAEGLLRRHVGERFDIGSAGTEPKEQVHPLAVRAMREIGIDISAHRPKHVTEFLGAKAVQHVLIVCDGANQTCPRVWPGAFSRTFMPFDDPAAVVGSDDDRLAAFRRARDEIDQTVRTWDPNAGPNAGPHARPNERLGNA